MGVGAVLRVHFTSEDLARVRVLAEPHPLWEVLLSLHLLQTKQGAVVFDSWRGDARTMPWMLTTLARPKGYSPDFLTPPVDTPDLETALESLLSTGKRRLREDIGVLATELATLPPWVAALGDGDTDTLRQLADSIREYHATMLAPHWPAIRADVHTSRAHRAELAVGHGVEHMLDTLHPGVRWRDWVLEVPYPVDQDLRLEGRGLTLAPSFFCWQTPITLADPTRTPMLVYPVTRTTDWTSCGKPFAPPHPRSLIALLGRTRATVLLTIAERPDLNTTELSTALGTSPATASRHTTVLLDAGLVTTHRHNGTARHRLSPVGRDLLTRPHQNECA
jgi:DNA-binding transcriptional ArsR family regulator